MFTWIFFNISDLSHENVPCAIRLKGHVRAKLMGDSWLVKSFSRLKRTIQRLQNFMERVSSRAQRVKKSLNEWASRLNGWKIFFFTDRVERLNNEQLILWTRLLIDSAYMAININNHYQKLYHNRFGNNSNIERSISNLKSKLNIS